MHYELIILSGGIEGYATALLAQLYGLKTAFVCVDTSANDEGLDSDLYLPAAGLKILDLLGFSSHSDKKIKAAHLAAFLRQRLIHNKQIAFYENIKTDYLALHQHTNKPPLDISPTILPNVLPTILPTVSLSYANVDTNSNIWQISSNFLMVGKGMNKFIAQQVFNPKQDISAVFARPYIRYKPNNVQSDVFCPAIAARYWRYGCCFLSAHAAYQPPTLALNPLDLAQSLGEHNPDDKYAYSLDGATYMFFSALQDAQNLFWKIFLVVNQRADANVLAAYQGERLPVVAAQLRLISDILEYKYIKASRKYTFFSNWFKKSPPVLSAKQEKLTCGIIANAVRELAKYAYQSAAIWGSVLPAFPLLGENGLALQVDKLQMAGFLLIGWGKNPVDWLEVVDIDFLAGLRAAFLQIIPAHQPFNPQIRHTTTAKDADAIPKVDATQKNIVSNNPIHQNQKLNNWQQWFAFYKSDFVLVRPDRVVFGTANNMQELSELMQQLKLKLGYKPIVWADLGEDIYDWAEKAQVDL